MAPESIIQRNFASGELAPAQYVRADLEKYISGLRTCRNFIVQREGGVSNRPGLKFIGATKTTNVNKRLVPYVSEIAGDSILIEAGIQYFRFWKNGAQVNVAGVAAWSNATNYVIGNLVSRLGVNYYCTVAHINQQPPNAGFWYALTGTIFEVPSPFLAANGILFNFVQSGNVITFTEKLHDPVELIYFGLTNWVVRTIDTTPQTATPTGLAGTAGSAGVRNMSYLVTAAAEENYEESQPSAAFLIANCGEPTPDTPNVLTWAAPTVPVAESYIYCDPYGNGTYGFIGTATGAESFNDVGFVADFGITPPINRTPFVSADTRPHLAAYHQQRRFFAGSNAEPEAIEASRTGFPSNFGISSPLQDDDAISFKIVGGQHNPVRHLIGLKTLVVLTDGGGWTVGEPKTPLTPSNIPADQEIYVGAAPDVAPAVVGNSIIYLQARASIMRDLRFDQEIEGFAGRDLTVFSSHLFKGYTIKRMAHAATPHSIVWVVRSDGTLLGLTYLRDQELWGWHRHDTDGVVEDVCIVPESTEDAVYVLVRRTINAATVRYIERFAKREIGTFDVDCFFVDSGLSYSGAPATVFSGLGHLEGEVVAVVADGSVIFDGRTAVAGNTVTGGAITLAVAASNVHIGLPIPSPEIETLSIDVQGAVIRDKQKRVGSITVIVDESSRSFSAGPDSGNLTRYELSPLETAADEHTGQVEMTLSATFEREGRVLIRQTDPLPITILGVLPNLIVGG